MKYLIHFENIQQPKYSIDDYVKINQKNTPDFDDYPYAKIINYCFTPGYGNKFDDYVIEYFELENNRFETCDDITDECIERKMTQNEILNYEIKKSEMKYNI